MRVMRVNDGNSEATYEVRGLTEDQAAQLAALADFPQWSQQPAKVAEFCAALHGSVERALPWAVGIALRADVHDMTAHTTV